MRLSTLRSLAVIAVLGPPLLACHVALAFLGTKCPSCEVRGQVRRQTLPMQTLRSPKEFEQGFITATIEVESLHCGVCGHVWFPREVLP